MVTPTSFAASPARSHPHSRVQPGLARRARLVASEHFLEKPFSADRLLLTIDLALQRSARGLPTMIG